MPSLLDTELNEIVFAYANRKGRANADLLNISEQSQNSREVRMDLALLDPIFDKWLIENEALTGVLNQGLTKKKNLEFRQKLDAWKKRTAERKRIKRRTFEQAKKVREEFQKYLHDFEHDRDPILDCQVLYQNLIEDLNKARKEERVTNDLLAQLPDAIVLEISLIEKIVDSLQSNFNAEVRVMERFAGWVRSDIIINQFYFNFFDIPELIVKRGVSKRDYECISKMLVKVKRSYLVLKASIMPDRPLAEINVTDDDRVPIELF